MRKHHPTNERIKRQYLAYLEEAKRMSTSSVDQVAAAIALFEASTGWRDFGDFHVEQARKFSREFKIEAVRLVRERGVSVAQASRDLDVHENVVRKWVKEFGADPKQAFPGHGQMKPEQLEIDRLRREVAKLKAERDILKKAAAYFAREST